MLLLNPQSEPPGCLGRLQVNSASLGVAVAILPSLLGWLIA